MENQALNPITAEIIRIKSAVYEKRPLIHCLTNHIVINQAANIILSVGAKPIMAEYPKEVADITKHSDALLVNLGNINSERLRAMSVSGKASSEYMIPSVLDLVGITCSKTRFDFANKFIKKYRPMIVKGNMSEFKAIAGIEYFAFGVDADSRDVVKNESYIGAYKELVRKTAMKLGVTLFVTGKYDIISDGNYVVSVLNGCEELGKITGTGCMLGAMCAAFLPCGASYMASTLAAAMMGIAGEKAKAQNPAGLASFQTAVLDNIYSMTDDDIISAIKIV